MSDYLTKFKSRLEAAGIQYKEKTYEGIETYTQLIFEIPSGRETHECTTSIDEEILQEILECQFDKFKFLKGYEAIWSKELSIIEAEINSTIGPPGRFFFDRLNKIINKRVESEEEDKEYEITSIDLPGTEEMHFSIGYCSDEFSFLSRSRERGPRSRNLKRITFKIGNIKSQTHDTAKELLEKIANSIFFQIDLAFELTINLQSQREGFHERRKKISRKQMFVDSSTMITEPKYEYDLEPISLYWYAKESLGMPIFQYLAFYQTIEFYFPIYSSFEAKQKIQSIIKDPRFNANRDSDISKIISTIKISSGGKSFGSEKEQLRATLASCTDNNELSSFFKLDEVRFNFYSENKGKNISKSKISVKSDAADLITEVSERIYAIRCRIVHTKATEGDFEVLLPYSSEVKELNYDLELIEFIARKVLINSSRPIRLQ